MLAIASAASCAEDRGAGSRGADPVDLRASSTYVPVDSWIYAAMARLQGLGYLRTSYLGMRPWTRSSVQAMLDDARAAKGMPEEEEAVAIVDAVERELRGTPAGAEIESMETIVRAIRGPMLDDGFHLGQTFVNDFGRPTQPGFNDFTGFSARAAHRRVSLYVRGEFEHAPGGPGYSASVASELAAIDHNPDVAQSTIPAPMVVSATVFRLLEANVSVRAARHEISFGKSDAWLGPGFGGAMAWSNNAENIYSFRVNRVEPLHIPGLSRLIGPARYDFFVGSLKGHSFPNDPWIHSEKFSFKPTENVEFGFERAVIWGGKGHVPVTVGTFLRSFFSISGVQPEVKFSRADPGARFSSFDMTYRLPGLRRWLTVYTDSTAHDDAFPVGNPPHAGVRPGLYLVQFPGAHKLDLRVEGVSTDPPVVQSSHGGFLYYEAVQTQGYTNQGHLIGDWIGRQAKGGQAWLTWHLDGVQQVQMTYRNAKAAAGFIPGGTTQHDIGVFTRLRPQRNVEVAAGLQGELWRAPLIASGQRHDLSATVQLTYFPHWRITVASK